MQDVVFRVAKTCEIILPKYPIRRPIKIDDVLEGVVSGKHIDKIELVPSDMNPKIIFGIYKKILLPDGTRLAKIYYSSKASDAERRFAITKELVHVFDNEKEETKPEDVEELLERVCSRGLIPDGDDELKSERRAVVCALELLLPYEWRIELAQKWEKTPKDVELLANSFVVPPHMMSVALNAKYNAYIKGQRAICGLKH